MPHGPALGGGASRRCALCFEGRHGKGRPGTFGALEQSRYVTKIDDSVVRLFFCSDGCKNTNVSAPDFSG